MVSLIIMSPKDCLKLFAATFIHAWTEFSPSLINGRLFVRLFLCLFVCLFVTNTLFNISQPWWVTTMVTKRVVSVIQV